MKASQLILEQSNYSSILTPDIKYLGKLFSMAGFELRVVGGAVRDFILGKTPKDIDLATNATPDEMLKIAKTNNIKFIETGLQHGTLTFMLNDTPYEITTLRVDEGTDGRHAEVSWTRSFEEDAKRRDLTYNAMSIDMNGKLYDYFNGVKDLKNHDTNFVGSPDKRIKEDYLRILRYFRFLGKQSQVKNNEKISQSIKQNINGLNSISGERIWEELKKILTGKNVKDVLIQMHQTGTLKELGINSNRNKILDSSIASQKTNSPITVLCCLIDNEFEFLKFNNRMKLSTPERKLGIFLSSYKNNNINEDDVKQELAVDNKYPKEYYMELAIVLKNDKLYNSIKEFKVPDFPVNGNDLIKKGISPGIELGNALYRLKNKWFKSNFKTSKEDLLRTIDD